MGQVTQEISNTGIRNRKSGDVHGLWGFLRPLLIEEWLKCCLKKVVDPKLEWETTKSHEICHRRALHSFIHFFIYFEYSLKLFALKL